MINQGKPIVLICIVVSMYFAPQASAQVIRKRIPYAQPTVLLIRLPTYSNKIAIYEKNKNRKYMEQSKKDAVGMQKAIIKDFASNFTYCNFYYYYDTMQQAITAQHFVGVLYDKNLQPVTQTPVQEGDTSYQIAYFGRYLQASVQNDEAYNTGSNIQRMNIVNYQLKRLPDPLPNGSIRTGITEVWRKVFNRDITYKSKLFDVYYIRSAENISTEMNKYYRGIK